MWVQPTHDPRIEKDLQLNKYRQRGPNPRKIRKKIKKRNKMMQQ